ncbi:MAG: sigma-70 family RNA polymerase sigma factor [Phycisphaera sp.]|nr:sigma-70 family RNA polymerase sigma factor [Phycisphaera sp.]
MTTVAHNEALRYPASGGAEDLRSITDGELLACLRDGRRAALAELAERYAGPLTRVAYLHLGDSHAAEDASQDALLAAWDAAGRTDRATPLWPWLLGIVANRCRKQLRTLGRRRRREQLAGHATRDRQRGASSDASAGVERDDRLEAMRRALLTLDDAHRIAVILRYEQGLSVADTATALKVPEGTIKRRCFTAVRRLRSELGA